MASMGIPNTSTRYLESGNDNISCHMFSNYLLESAETLAMVAWGSFFPCIDWLIFSKAGLSRRTLHHLYYFFAEHLSRSSVWFWHW